MGSYWVILSNRLGRVRVRVLQGEGLYSGRVYMVRVYIVVGYYRVRFYIVVGFI
jgi:hypothetical protein